MAAAMAEEIDLTYSPPPTRYEDGPGTQEEDRRDEHIVLPDTPATVVRRRRSVKTADSISSTDTDGDELLYLDFLGRRGVSARRSLEMPLHEPQQCGTSDKLPEPAVKNEMFGKSSSSSRVKSGDFGATATTKPTSRRERPSADKGPMLRGAAQSGSSLETAAAEFDKLLESMDCDTAQLEAQRHACQRKATVGSGKATGGGASAISASTGSNTSSTSASISASSSTDGGRSDSASPPVIADAIIVDTNSAEDEIFVGLSTGGERNVLRKRLDLGDIHLIGQGRCLVVERKEICDLAASIKDGRWENLARFRFGP
mmetsp:Transcript_28459/g.63532  ORF Transcript_28459/g.63532 Transcript_28459/m.63532 type:complete len:315 (-) Transcript_28459:1033-1977(-)